MILSQRIRGGIEAAPWVLREVLELEAERDALKQANSDLARASIIQEGWQLVPIEPTDGMYSAGYESVSARFVDAGFCLGHAGVIFRAMLLAAKEQQA